jgi:meso-butanediol dehydrogenase/(S,S)-butanediol dehydrogenase/diacetyl reductase
MGRVDGKAAIVTGAASGLGRAAAERLAEEGACVCVSDVDAAAGKAVVDGIKQAGGKAIFVKADVSKERDAERLVNATVKTFGRIDVLVNNAGIRASGSVHQTSLADWEKIMAVDLRGVYLCARFAVPHMLEQRAGSIINISSVSGVLGDYGMAAYNAAKGGVTNLTRNMALDYARDGIRVNAVCPGSIMTPMLEGAYSEIGHREASRKFNAAYPPGRVGEPREVAHLILFLASDESRFVSGANILIDGGITAHTGQPKFEAK